MSFQKEYRMIHKIKKYFSGLFGNSKTTASSGRQNLHRQEVSGTEEGHLLHQQEEAAQSTMEQKETTEAAKQGLLSNADNTDDGTTHDMQGDVQGHSLVEDNQFSSENDLIAGGIYAVQEQDIGPDTSYWLAKVIYIEKQVVHVLCYAERITDLSQEIHEQELTLDLNREDSSSGLAHLPLPKADFAANAVLLGQSSLTDKDLAGYQIYVDSVFDCLDEQAPDWLKKAGSYAAWRYDPNAMAALADRYLIGVDLLRDSKKSLYWLNRIVHAGKGLVQPGTPITEEQQILTGGVYACPLEEGRYHICKVVLKDKHGVQQLDFPSQLGQLPEDPHPVKTIEQASARRAGKPPVFSHASLHASDFLAQSPIFLGLLPITLNELHCYRAHLRKMFDGAAFRENAWDNILRRAQQGEVQAQIDIAYGYLDGDPFWEVQRNIPEAIRWFTEAANQGHSLAAYNLALLFQQGEEGIQPDPQLGLEWLTYSAQLNYGLAQLHTADCYQQGKGCPANPALAHAWYSLPIIADNGLPEAARKKARQRKYDIEGTCSDKQLAAAKHYFLQLQGAGAGNDALSRENTYGNMYT